METLKIAFYTDTFLPAHDGVVSSMLSFRKELKRRGHEVYIYASGNRQTKEMVKGEKDIFVLRSMKFRLYPQYNLALTPFKTGANFSEIAPDIVHSQTPFIVGSYALAFAKIYKLPLVSTFHTMITDKRVIEEYTPASTAKLLKRYSWKYARFYYNKCNSVIAPSQTISDLLKKNDIENVNVIPNGIDTNRFSADVDGSSLRKKLKRSRDEKIVLCLGRVSKEKNLETVLKAAKLLKKAKEPARFIIAGTGPAANYYQNLARRLKVDDVVDFVGFVDDKVLPKYYAASDVFCTASTFETQGIVAYEAMAMGKPVVGADSLALKEAIKNGKNGERFKPYDAKACASKIKKVLNNIDSYNETRRTAEQYSIGKMTDELLNLYKDILNKFTPL